MMKDKLDLAIKEAINKKCNSFVIYYSGHGSIEHGGWMINLEKASLDMFESIVTLDEVLKVIDESEYKGDVEITSDSCYSGQICYHAKAWWEKHKRNGHNISKIKNLRVVASSHGKLRSEWG